MTVGFNTGSKWFDSYMEAFYEVIECYYKNLSNKYFDYSSYYRETILSSAKETAKSLEGIYDNVYYKDYYENYYRNYFVDMPWDTIWAGYGYGNCDVDKIIKKWGFSSRNDETKEAEDSLNSDGGISSAISMPRKFKKKFVDKIINFNISTDSLEINVDDFGVEITATFAAGKNKKKVKKKLAKQDFDFLYDQKKGGLYFNENGADKGFGDGGIIAILKGAPELTSGNLEFV